MVRLHAHVCCDCVSIAGATDVALPLGDFFFYGIGGAPVDVSRAAELYTRAVEAGNPQAAYNLGYLVRDVHVCVCVFASDVGSIAFMRSWR